MSGFKGSLVVLFVLLAVSDMATSQSLSQWLLQRQQQEQQQQQEQEQQRGALRDRIEQLRQKQLLLELQEEREKTLREEMEDLLGNYELEDLAQELGTYTLSRILRPLREQPTEIPLQDCVTKNWDVEFDFGLTGTIVYNVCGSGDGASLNLRIVLPGQTTPASEITTPVEGTPGRPLIMCPTLPTTAAPETTTATFETTTPTTLPTTEDMDDTTIAETTLA